MKYQLVAFLFIGIISIQAQKLKKGLPAKKPAIAQTTSTKINEGIFATIVTNKGSIVIQLEYQKNSRYRCQFCKFSRGKKYVCNG